MPFNGEAAFDRDNTHTHTYVFWAQGRRKGCIALFFAENWFLVGGGFFSLSL